jgi:DNA-binding PadR family transcriptional regulator
VAGRSDLRESLSDLGRFTDVALLILLSLASGPKHGYAILRDIAEFSGTRFEPGTLYGALLRLQHRALIEALPPRDRRNPYRLTNAGTAILEQQMATLRQLVRVGTRRRVLS